MRAFKDSSDGYYEYGGIDIPSWAGSMTPCPVQPVTLSLEQIVSHMDGLVEDLLNATAKRKGYASSDRLAGYSASVAFGADALAFIAWRDEVWIHCTALLNGVMAGTAPIPTDAELLSGLPLFNAW